MRPYLILAVTIVVAGCAGDAPTTPASSSAATRNREYSSYPGSSRTADALTGKFVPLNCTPREAAAGAATIGPPGGELHIGTHRLIVPPGALREWVHISGSVPADQHFRIDLQPHGLQFHRAAGLVLDASNCTDVPAIVYIIDEYNYGPPIEAIYSNLWMTIASPIWHFSGYIISLGENSEANENGAQ